MECEWELKLVVEAAGESSPPAPRLRREMKDVRRLRFGAFSLFSRSPRSRNDAFLPSPPFLPLVFSFSFLVEWAGSEGPCGEVGASREEVSDQRELTCGGGERRARGERGVRGVREGEVVVEGLLEW